MPRKCSSPSFGTVTPVTSVWRCANTYNFPAPVIDSDSDSVAEEIPHHKTEPSEQVQEELEDAVPVKEEFTAKENGDNGADNVGDDDGEDDENDDDSEV